LGFPFNISATTEGSDFKIGRQVVFAKTHHNIPPRRKSGRGHGLGEIPKILRFPFNISATTEASEFKIGRLVAFAKAHHKISPKRKGGRGPGLGEFPKMWSFPFNIYAEWLKVSTSNLVHIFGGQLGPSENHTNDKSRPRSLHCTFSTKLRIPLIIFVMAQVAIDVPNKQYYIENCKY